MKPLNPLKGTLAEVILFNSSSLFQQYSTDEYLIQKVISPIAIEILKHFRLRRKKEGL